MPRIRLNGTVMSNDNARLYRYFGFYDVCCPNDVRRAIENCPEDEEITLEINSGGGSVYAGFEMYNVIRNSTKKTKAEVFSIAGSAASVVMSGCDEVLMSPVSNVMIHRSAIGRTGGNAERLRQDAQMLDSVDESILNAYVAKSNGKTSRTQFRHMMERETFMTAQDAINCGLADGILEKRDSDGELDPMNAVASIAIEQTPVVSALMLNMRLPPVDDLRRIQEERTKLNSSHAEGVSVQDITAKKEEREETMAEGTDINTREELIAAYPELIAQIQADAQSAERDRISAIDGVALPGFEAIVAAAKADPTKNAGTVAMEIIQAQKQQGGAYLKQARQDAQESNANQVPGAETPDDSEGTGGDMAQAVKSAVADFEKGGFR